MIHTSRLHYLWYHLLLLYYISSCTKNPTSTTALFSIILVSCWQFNFFDNMKWKECTGTNVFNVWIVPLTITVFSVFNHFLGFGFLLLYADMHLTLKHCCSYFYSIHFFKLFIVFLIIHIYRLSYAIFWFETIHS